MYNPICTYRIQFHKDFNFNDFERIIPYLEELGISTIYASPIFCSVPGSMHGYDGIDPLTINPEIGTIEQLRNISKKLKEKSIGWLQDIVPNHMAYHPDNTWLTDVLENGISSAYAKFFDDSLSDSLLFKGPIMVPFLGSDLEDVVEKGELKIVKAKNKLVFKYAEQTWPLKPESYPHINDINTVTKEQLLQIANEQHYRLCGYQETDQLINFRRFFTVNSLICLNMQNDEVFDKFHQLIIQLVNDDVFQGIRIDHIDGLYDPSKYLAQLRKAVGDETYIVVEKILEKGEQLLQWPIQGSTGYDFLALVNNLLTGSSNKHKLLDFYKTLINDKQPVLNQIHDKKAYILHTQMSGELDNLTNLFLEADIIKHRKISKEDIKQVIALFLINCPDYRFYGNNFPLAKEEEDEVRKILLTLKSSNKQLADAVTLLEMAFFDSKHNHKALHFYMRCMQFTGPLMAKGVEDTLMYTYNPFIAHNEVGDAPGAFSVSVADFHQMMKKRQKKWPISMNATSTHDTKRGEDMRARLNVLPDIADEWLRAVTTWQQMNLDIRQIGAPEPNEEYFIYQTIMGAYPMPGSDEDNFSERLVEYLQKTMREAKLHSNWATPNEGYETAVKEFAVKLLDKRRPFWKSFSNLHHKVSEQGVINSFSQLILKFTCPGTPDIYQGCEHWDFSLVDPDNRRPVDYESHKVLITENIPLPLLWKNKFDGQIKIWLTQLLMRERKANALLFAEGDYIPLAVKGKYAASVFAFARRYKLTWYVTVVPLNMARLTITDWENTRLIMPPDAPEDFENLISKTKGKQKQELKISEIFSSIPFALLKLEHSDDGRGAGILMHITSLSSKFGIGDFGPEAKTFADSLHNAYQKYWQVLPLSPVDKRSNYSPYSANSSMAGNILLLSPDLLIKDGAFEQDEYILPNTGNVEFDRVSLVKQLIFDKAWINFNNAGSEIAQIEFIEFCKREASWLNDYALYVVLKGKYDNAPWYNWPDEFKLRSKKSLSDFIKTNIDAIEREKWLQYQFTKQWGNLKRYCNQLDIQLLGDLPFYISYDSVDVWANPEFFSLDNDGNMIKVAGVPPDYFSADGQLWGMPVFRWDKLKERGYEWWLQRIQKNLERFDLLRLDHFRAFANYWSVSAGDKTAANGKWEKGPGKELFNEIKKTFGKLPFVAEDLGDIDESVHELRNEFELPGMRILQFAFGGDVALSPHAPHNYNLNSIVYTGTHDNNTIKGWYYKEANKDVKKRLNNYTESKIKKNNINDIFIRMVMASVSRIAIVPMQDILSLDENARMNVPGATEGNWLWRITTTNYNHILLKKYKRLTQIYNRM